MKSHITTNDRRKIIELANHLANAHGVRELAERKLMDVEQDAKDNINIARHELDKVREERDDAVRQYEYAVMDFASFLDNISED